ncbi:MAG: hypothetical protein JW900_02115 [Anaerolineae bacterium]|nr:hypothetical protein [Anaerolineae bacterium]
MTMDMTQASQMLKWLDEERRRDRTIIATLQERLETQSEQLERLEQRFAALQKTVTGLEALVARASEFPQVMEEFKADLTHSLELRDEQYRKGQREMEQGHQLDIGALKNEITRMSDGLRPVARLDERMTIMQAEEQRLNEILQRLDATVSDLSKRTEDRLQSVTYLEEQRRADHQRINTLEIELPEVRKRIEAYSAKLLLLEDATQKQRARLEEGLKPIKEFEQIVQDLRISDFHRNQEVKQWLDQADKVRVEMERLREERQRFLSDYRDVQDVLKRLETFQTRIDVRQNEVAEMQRLAEERVKRQWEEWQSKQEKERHNWEVTVGERWREQDRFNNQYKKQLDSITPVLKTHKEQLDVLWDILRADAARTLKSAQDKYQQLVSDVDRQQAILREQPKEGKA